jgi:uncharacterized repeat protein (TIGR01451 family)
VQGNFIGTTAAGTATAANGTGIRVRTYNAVEVGTVASNTIAFNGIGTEVLDGPAEILSNSFFSNTTGIVVAGTGNPGELPPTLSTAVSNAVSTRITGSLAVPLEPSTLYRLQFFSNPVSEDQGRTFVGETTVTTDGSGNASFDVTFPISVPAGQFVTATATNTPEAETSAFAQDIVVTALVANLTLSKTTTSTTVTTGETISYTITVTNTGPDPATGVTITDTIPANTTFISAIPTQGSCSGNPTVTCSIGTLANGASATVTLQVQAASPGSAVNSASATGNETDPDGASATAPAVTVTGAALAPVPTLSVWAMIAMGLAIAFVGMRMRL